jgi:uncharacterized UBP type Zn finger protein
MELQEIVKTLENNRRTALLNGSNETNDDTYKKSAGEKREDEQYILRPIYEIVKIDKSKAVNFEEYTRIRFWHSTETEQFLSNGTLRFAINYLYQYIQNCINEVNLNNKFPFFKKEENDSNGGFTRRGLLTLESSSIVPGPKPEKKIIPPPNPKKIEKKRIFTIKGKGIPQNMTGLEWFGNHCYANAAFQFLFACHTVRDFVKEYSGENNFITAVRELFNAMADNGESIIKSSNSGDNIGLKALYTSIGQAAKNAPIAYGRTVRELGSSSDQKDAYELLGEIVNEVAKSEERLKGLYSNINCPACQKTVSVTKAQDSCLEINISSNSFDECFSKTFAPEIIEYKCPECKNNVNATISREFVKLPDVLILRLKRFLQTTNGKRSKISSSVAYNETLKVPNGLLTYYLKDSDPKDAFYKLKAIVNHSGTLDGGHYTATIFNDKDNKWYAADGASINLANKNGVFQQSPNAYVFMYEKYAQK